MKTKWSELTRLSAALADLYAPGGIEEFPQRMLAAMRELLPSSLYIYHEFTPAGLRTVENPGAITPDLVEAFVAHQHEHPTLTHVLQTGSHDAFMFSDFISQREFRETGIYREAFRKVGVDRQIGGVFAARDRKIGYAFNRGGTSYTEEDRLLVNLIVQHMTRARSQAELWSLRFATVPGRAGSRFLGVDADGRARLEVGGVRELLDTYFPGCGEVPEPVLRWMRAQRAGLQGHRDAPSVPQPLQVESPRGRLIIHYAPAGADGIEYLLLEEKTAPSLLRLKELGLTEREAEVLFWVSEGKRNSEISIILGNKDRTVSKHLEHIFAKLGVETRTAAAALARETLL